MNPAPRKLCSLPRDIRSRIVAALMVGGLMMVTAAKSSGAVIWTPSLEKSLRQRYLSDSKLDLDPGDNSIVAHHFANLEESPKGAGTIFEVAQVATQSGVPMRPWKLLTRPRLYFVRNDGTRIEEYFNHPGDSGYVVFTRFAEEQPEANHKPRSLRDVVVVKIDSSSELEAIHLAVDGRSSFAGPLFLTGTTQDSNDGSNAPWWNWSMQYVFAHTSPQVIQGSKWVASAILDERGCLITGNFSPRELQLNETETAEVRIGGWQIQNDVQRAFSNLFYSDSEVRKRHENRKRSIVLRKRRSNEIEPEGYQLTGSTLEPKRVSWIEADTVDHARGSYAKPNYRHRLVIHFEDGERLSVIFQNNLRSLIGRPLEFRGPLVSMNNPWYPVELWVGDRFSPDHQEERSLLNGSVVFRQLKIDPATGVITAVQAELTYEDPRNQDEKLVGYLNLKSITPLNAPVGASFCNRWIASEGEDVSLSRQPEVP